jgi:histidinol-phosphatase (PHP family)
MECEYVPEFMDYQRALLTERGYDYLVLGQHFSPTDDGWCSSFEWLRTRETLHAYAGACIRGMESGLYAFLAHPDIFGCCGTAWGPDQESCADEICAAARNLDVPLEINGYGLRKPTIDTPDGRRRMYPWMPFWAVAARHGCRVILSSDAHRPQDALAGHAELSVIRDRFGLAEIDMAARILKRG